MAVAAAARFCGRCGAQLPPGASFCGRCGTPVMRPAAAASPIYSYAPAAYPRPQTRLVREWLPWNFGPVTIAASLIVILAIAGLVPTIVFIASQLAGRGHATCTTNCPPKFGTRLPEDASFTSTAFGFTVNYSSRWTVRDQSAEGVTLGTRLGQVQVTGTKGSSPEQAIQGAIATLPTSKWQDVAVATPSLHGAHLGDVQGVGAIYAANLVGASQTAAKVRIALMAATKDGVTVLVMAVNPADPKASANAFPEAQLVDYLCTEFVWKGET